MKKTNLILILSLSFFGIPLVATDEPTSKGLLEASRVLDVLGAWQPAELSHATKKLLISVFSGNLGDVQKYLKDPEVQINTTDQPMDAYSAGGIGTPLQHAISHGHKHIIDYLLTEPRLDVNARNMMGNSALHEIIKYTELSLDDQKEVIIKLINKEPNLVNTKNFDGNTPLFYVKNLEIALLLLSKGALLKVRNNRGQTALHLKGPHPEIVNLLADTYADLADLNAQDSRGWTALHNFASTESAAEAITILLKKGTDPNIKNRYGFTPLYSAAFAGLVENAKALLASPKINLTIKANTELTALEQAETIEDIMMMPPHQLASYQKGRAEVARAIKEHLRYSPLRAAWLVSLGAATAVQDEYPTTAGAPVGSADGGAPSSDDRPLLKIPAHFDLGVEKSKFDPGVEESKGHDSDVD